MELISNHIGSNGIIPCRELSQCRENLNHSRQYSLLKSRTFPQLSSYISRFSIPPPHYVAYDMSFLPPDCGKLFFLYCRTPCSAIRTFHSKLLPMDRFSANLTVPKSARCRNVDTWLRTRRVSVFMSTCRTFYRGVKKTTHWTCSFDKHLVAKLVLVRLVSILCASKYGRI